MTGEDIALAEAMLRRLCSLAGVPQVRPEGLGTRAPGNWSIDLKGTATFFVECSFPVMRPSGEVSP